MNWRMVAFGAASLALLGCAKGGESANRDSVAASSNAAMETLSWRLEAPPTWDDRIRMVDDPEGAAKLAAEGIHSARLFDYLPYDTTIVPQTLLGVYVYDSASWARLEREEGPPQGTLVARGPGAAYVVGLPQSNPFAGGTRDSVEFDRRTVDLEFVKKAFHVVR